MKLYTFIYFSAYSSCVIPQHTQQPVVKPIVVPVPVPVQPVVTPVPIVVEPPVVTPVPIGVEPPVVTPVPIGVEPPVVTPVPIVVEPPVPIVIEPPVPIVVEPPVQQNNQGSRTSIPTYYFRVGPDIEGCAPVQNFDDGMSYGPCNGNQGVKYTSESKYWVAINGAKAHCGKQIRVNYQGNSLDLTVMDECPGCGEGNTKIDVGLESLIELTGSKEVACSIGRLQPEVTWDFI